MQMSVSRQRLWNKLGCCVRQKPETRQTGAAEAIKDLRRATRKQYSAEEKIRIVLDGLRGEGTIAELCRHEGIAQSIYYKWSKELLEAGKRRLAGVTARAAPFGAEGMGMAEPTKRSGAKKVRSKGSRAGAGASTRTKASSAKKTQPGCREPDKQIAQRVIHLLRRRAIVQPKRRLQRRMESITGR